MLFIQAPHIGEFRVDDGGGHSYAPRSLKDVQSVFLQIKYSGGVPTVYQWDEGLQRYEFSQSLTDEMHAIPRLPGRPRQYPVRRKTTLELPLDLEAAIEKVRGQRGLGAYIVEVLVRDAEIAQAMERQS